MIDIGKVEFKKFPGGELHLTDSWYQAYNRDDCIIINDGKILCRIQSSDDIMKLLLFVDSYRNVFKSTPSEVIIPYLPYARQDRYANIGEALSIRVFTQLLQLDTFKDTIITVFDPHSDVGTALIPNVNIIPQHKIWGKILTEENIGKFDLISPDAGALKKIYKLQSVLGNEVCNNIRIGTKHRDTQTGLITGTTVDGEPKHKTAVIVDDICDGGRTFIELCKVIRNQYDKILLCVTHGIFSKGLEVLNDFDGIYTLDSWGTIESSGKLKVYSINNFS